MNICVITSSYLPVIGGMQTVVYQLVRAWKTQGHEVHIVASRSNRRLPTKDIVDGTQVKRLYFVFQPPGFQTIPLIKYLILLFFIPSTLFWLWRCARKIPCDVVHVHLHLRSDLVPYLCLFSFFLRVPYVVTVHGLDMDFDPKKHMVHQFFTDLLLRRAHRITAVSGFIADQLRSFFPRSQSRLTVIRNGLDPVPLAIAKPYQHSHPYLLCVGRMTDRVKGQHVLIDAFRNVAAQIRDLELILVGDGSRRQDLQKMVQASDLEHRVLFFGSASSERVASLIKGCVLLIIPSLYEPFGIVCLEGAYASKPIVASRVGGIPEILEGYPWVRFVKPGSAIDLQEGILVAIQHWCNGKELSITSPLKLSGEILWSNIAQGYLAEFKR